MFGKILIANRGEIARRIIRACRTVGAKSVAVFSEADAQAPYLKEADEAVCIGPGPSIKSYLNQDILLKVAEDTGCHAIHPGFGFLSENALFATRCEQQKLTFIGPKPSHMRLMGDKASARETMQQAGLQVMPGSSGVLHNVEAALKLANEVGYPVLLKATAGGGGKGMRLVHDDKSMKQAYMEAELEAEKAFSNGSLYLEKFIVGARHIEFQVLADAYGHIIHLGERECSIQRSHQKLIEESPAFGMTPELRFETGTLVCKALKKIGYQNAGTVEFLMDAFGQLYFMEMNTRIQVEHPVTELVTGIDLVAWQIRLAAGERLSLQQEDVTWRGAAIECRINAEDPEDNFKPSPGKIVHLHVPDNSPDGPIRFDSHIEEGYQIPTFYDSMLGKLIAFGETREKVIERLDSALANLRIEGIKTTIGLHQKIITSSAFKKGGYTCRFLEENVLWQK